MGDAKRTTNAKITVKLGGPYLVEGGVPLVKKVQIVSEFGEPMNSAAADIRRKNLFVTVHIARSILMAQKLPRPIPLQNASRLTSAEPGSW
jgi:hypothetical protein